MRKEKGKLSIMLLKKCILILITSTGILYLAGTAAVMAATSAPDITSSSDWEVRGSAAFTQTGADVGDTIGYDSGDQDEDGNYQNQGKSGSGIDYDFIISKIFFEPPLTLEWNGCLAVTRYGYNMFGLGSLYNGGVFRQAVFQTRWEKQTAIQVWAKSGGSSYLTGVTPSDGKFCASYKLDWDNDGMVTFYYNGQQVFTGTKAIEGPLVFYVRTFEKPANISSFTITSTATTAPVVESCSTDTSSGNVPFDAMVTCRASGSSALTWSWDWDGDGINDETTKVDHATHTYDTPGTYMVTVTVSDTSDRKTQGNTQIVALAQDTSGFQGAISGNFTATVTMSDGTSKQVDGTVSGSWNASADAAGNIAATVQGTFGADGVSGAFNATYDSSTGQLTGSWGDIKGDFYQPITFKMDQGQGLSFSAPIEGMIPTSDGGLPFEGQVQVKLLGIPDASLEGTVDGTYSTDIEYEISGSTSYSILGRDIQIPVNLSDTISTSGNVEGTWQVSSASETFTGTASGRFSGVINTSVSTPMGPYLINIPYSGTWQGTLENRVSQSYLKAAGSNQIPGPLVISILPLAEVSVSK